MSEQITYYHSTRKTSPYCLRVELALSEAGASYTSHCFNVYERPEWFARVNPLTGKIPAITYGGPIVPPEEPSPLSFKLTESYVILEFLADLFPASGLLPPVTDPTARARVRLFMDFVTRNLEVPMMDRANKDLDKIVEGLEKIQTLLPPLEEGEYAIGKQFTNADCAIAPLLAIMELGTRVDIGSGRFGPGAGRKVGEALSGARFDRLRRYKEALWERESVKQVLDIDKMEQMEIAQKAQE